MEEKNIISLWMDNHYESLKEDFIDLHQDSFNEYVHNKYKEYCKLQMNIVKKNIDKIVPKK